MDGETGTPDPVSLYAIIKWTEKETGTRYCMSCDTLLPVCSFKSLNTKRFRCHTCFRATRRVFLSSQIQKAYGILLCKARRDKQLFGYSSITLSTKDIQQILTAEQIKNFSDWSIVPKNPAHLLTRENAVAIPNFQRRLLVSQWKQRKDPTLYAQNLQGPPPLCHRR
jgi:hypothetical protein